MVRLKLKFILLVCAMLIALTGCFNDNIENETNLTVGEEYNEGKGIIEKLTLEDFKKALQVEGLELISVEEERNDWILNNNKPNKF